MTQPAADPAERPGDGATEHDDATALDDADGAGETEADVRSEDGPFRPTGEASAAMFDVLEATDEDVVAVRVRTGTTAGYRELYELLVQASQVHGSIHVYEEAPGWSPWTYLSHVHGIVPDFTYGPDFEIERYAAVGDSAWSSALYYQWRAVAPVWPVSPEEMRLYDLEEREAALEWVRTGEEPGEE